MIFRSMFRALARKGYPIITPIIRDLYRITGIVRFGFIPLARSLSWYFKSNEYTNFTYNISQKSEKYLSSFLANALNASREEIITYLNEVKQDTRLREHFVELVPRTADRYFADLPIKYGRRIGWYVLLRILKPRIVVEAGVDRGIGTCVLAAAMLRNTEQGHGGKIIGLDINPYAGQYLAEPYSSVIDLVIGDSLEFLRTTRNEVDVFIHDSNHSREHESREYELVGPKLSKNGVIVSDNAGVTDCLFEFALKNSMVFNYWQEEVVRHVASPGGIALAVSGSAKAEIHQPK